MFNDKYEPFSVILSLYKKENKHFFSQSLQSIWDDQILKPNEIILVLDGEITNELYEVVSFWKNKLGNILKIVPISKNVGLALALNEGLKHCKYNLIARMDTDDISMPDRFEKQIKFMGENPKIDVIGGCIMEIDENNNIVKEILKVPLSHSDILNMFRKRNVMVHPTVMFRKSFFTKAGYYSNELLLAEDYYLWYMGFLSGCQFANIQDICLKFRRSTDFYKRRSGLKKLTGILKFRLFKCNRNLKFGISSDIYAIVYFLIQVSPTFLKKIAYKWLR